MPDRDAEIDLIDNAIPCRSRSRAALVASWRRGIQYANPEHEFLPRGTPAKVECGEEELFYNARTPPEILDHSTSTKYEPRVNDDLYIRLLPYRAIYANQALHGNLFPGTIMPVHPIMTFGANGRFDRRIISTKFGDEFKKKEPKGDENDGIFTKPGRNGSWKCVIDEFTRTGHGGEPKTFHANFWDACKCPWDSSSIEVVKPERGSDRDRSIPACIENYHDLKELAIPDQQVSDVANLASAPGLERLDISKNNLHHVPSIVWASLPRLKKLSIEGQRTWSDRRKQKFDAANFDLLKALESLDISMLSLVKKDDWILGLPRLKKIDASVTNFCLPPATSKKPVLKELVLNDASCNTDGDDIATWTGLERLEIANTNLENGKELGKLTRMKVLDLSRNEEVGRDKKILEAIGKMTSIEALRLHDVGLGSLDFAKELMNLKKLDISDNGVDDFTPLAGLNHLSRFNACANMIKPDAIESFKAIGNVDDIELGMNRLDLRVIEKLPGARKIGMFDGYSLENIPDDVKNGKNLEMIDMRAEEYATMADDIKMKLRLVKGRLSSHVKSVRLGKMPEGWHNKCPEW